MFAIPTPIAPDFGSKGTDVITSNSTLIIRPNADRKQNAEFLDLHAAQYASDLGSRETHSVSDMLSSRIDQIFSTATLPTEPKWTRVDNPSRATKPKGPEYPVLGNPARSAPIPKWVAKMTTLTHEVNEQIGQDKADELEFRKRETDYIREIGELNKTIAMRVEILDEIDRENVNLRAVVDNLERELAWYRDN